MGYSFRPGLHVCCVDRTLVFLDVQADRYFSLAGRSNTACRRLVTGEPETSGDGAIIAKLVVDGILVAGPESARPALCISPPEIQIGVDDVCATAGRPAVARALAQMALARTAINVLPLHVVLDRFVRTKARGSGAHANRVRLAEIEAAFLAADQIISSYGRCLTRSVALAYALLASEGMPSLIFGVKLRPFEAHCWVQQGDRLVADDPNTVATFTPILTL